MIDVGATDVGIDPLSQQEAAADDEKTRTQYDETPEKKPQFKCDRHGKYKPSKRKPGEKRRVKTSTKKTDCQMTVDAFRDIQSGRWYIKVLNDIEVEGKVVCVHNHPPSKRASSHTAHWQMDLSEAVVKAIITDAEVGIRPSQTLARLLAHYPELSLRTEDIINTRKRIEHERIGDMTRTEYLLSLLQSNGATTQSQLDQDDRVSHLFFASREVLRVYSEGPDVILMYCAYKMNKFGMPLLNMIGISGMSTTTHLAHAFLRGEKIAAYRWALAALKETLMSQSISLPNVIFVDCDLALLNVLNDDFPMVPVLLCLWHVIKAVGTHVRKTFQRVIDKKASNEQGNQVMIDTPEHREFCDVVLCLVRANTEKEYEQYRVILHALSKKEATYVDSTWLENWKTKILR